MSCYNLRLINSRKISATLVAVATGQRITLEFVFLCRLNYFDKLDFVILRRFLIVTHYGFIELGSFIYQKMERAYECHWSRSK